jgi:hypothetical protein
MLNLQQPPRELCELPPNTGAHYDSQHNVVYYTQGHQLFELDLETSKARTIPIKKLSAGSPDDVPQIPRLRPLSEQSKAYVSPSGLYIVNVDQ